MYDNCFALTKSIFDKSIEDKCEQPLNIEEKSCISLAVSFLGRINVSKFEHPLNIELISCILTKDKKDISIDVNLLHPANIYLQY